MADNILELIVKATTAKFDAAMDASKVKADSFSKDAKKHFRDVEKAVDSLGDSGKKLSGVFGDMVEAYAGSKILQFAKSFVDAAAEAQARAAALDVALANNGKAAEGAGKALDAYAQKLSIASGMALPKIIQGMTNFADMGMNVNQVMFASGVAADVAAAKHMDLAATQQVLARAIATGTGAGLSRLGIHLDGVNLKTAKLDVVMAGLAKTFAGQAAKHAKTFEGAMNRLGSQIDLLKESIGKQFLNVLTDLAEKTSHVIAVFDALSPQAKQLIGIIGGAIVVFVGVAAILPLVITLMRNMAFSFQGLIVVVRSLGVALEFLAANPIGLLIAALVGIGAAIYELVQHWSQFKSAAEEAIGYVKSLIGELWSYASEAFAGIAEAAGGIWKALHGDWAGASHDVSAGLGKVGDAMHKGAQKLKGIAVGIGHSIASGVAKGLHGIGSYVGGVFHMGKVHDPSVPNVANPGGWNQFDTQRAPKKHKAAHSKAAALEQGKIADAKDLIADKLQPYLDAIDDAKAKLDQLDVAEDRLKAKTGKNGPTADQQKELLRIEDARYKAHGALAASYLNQVHAERAAIAQLEQMQNQIAGNPALHAKYRELNGDIRTHITEIRRLKLEHEKATVDQAKDLQKRRADEDAYYQQTQAHLKKEQDARAEAAAIAMGNVENANAISRASRTHKNAIQDLQDTLSDKQAIVKHLQAVLDDAKALEVSSRGHADHDTYVKAADAALLNFNKATTDATIAQIKLNKQFAENSQNPFVSLRDKIEKTVPEITAFNDAIKNGASPLQALGAMFLATLERTQSFQAILKILGNIFQVIAAILDRIFLPIIKAVAKVLTSIVNLFIAFYNGVSDVLALIGIHIQKLRYINSLLDDFGASAKSLIDVQHDMPTLKEYGAGSWGPLLPDTGGGNGLGLINNTLIANDKHQGSWLGKIIEGIGALLLIDWLTHGKWFSAFSGVFSHLFSWLPNLFSNLGSFLKNAWDAVGQFLGTKLGSLAEMGAGIWLISNHTGGMLGVLEKIVGVLLIIQSASNLFHGVFSNFAGQMPTWLGQLGTGLSNVFKEVGKFLGTKFGAVVELGAGIALIGTHTKGMLGFLEKILGVLLVIQSLQTLFGGGGGGALGGLGGLLGLTSGGGGGLGGLGGGGGLGGLKNIIGNPGAGTGIWSQGGTVAINALLGALLGKFAPWGGGTHEINGAIGGGVGGLLAALIPGLGWAGAAGALIGSLFGHKDNQALMPDKYNTAEYGQDSANVFGAGINGAAQFVANGSSFTEDSQVASALGNKGEAQTIAQYIAATGGAGLTQQEIQTFTGQGGDYNHQATAFHDGQWTLENGQHIQWDELVKEANDAITRIAAQAQSTANGGGTVGGLPGQTGTPLSPDEMLHQLIPSFDSLDGAVQQFIKTILGLTDSATKHTDPTLTGTDGGGGSTAIGTSGLSTLPPGTQISIGGKNSGVVTSTGGDGTGGVQTTSVASIAPPVDSILPIVVKPIVNRLGTVGKLISETITKTIDVSTDTAARLSTVVSTLRTIATSIAPIPPVATTPGARSITPIRRFGGADADLPPPVSINQTNTFGDIQGSTLDDVSQFLGRRARVLQRTQQYAI